jgi:hypothetical protein
MEIILKNYHKTGLGRKPRLQGIHGLVDHIFLLYTECLKKI